MNGMKSVNVSLKNHCKTACSSSISSQWQLRLHSNIVTEKKKGRSTVILG